MSRSGVYEIRNTINGHRYIGSAVNLRKRLLRHRYELCNETHCNPYLQKAWNKYGAHGFAFRTILYCDRPMLIDFEQRAMDILEPEYNINPTAGSILGAKLSDEHKANIRAGMMGKNKGRKLAPRSEEHRANLSAALMGHKNNTLEARAKMAAAAMGNRNCAGYKHTPEARANMSAAHKGKPWSEAQREARRRLSDDS